jgi:hypothetical protein
MGTDDAGRYLRRLTEAGKLRRLERGIYVCVLSVRVSESEGANGQPDASDTETREVSCTVCGFPLDAALAAAGETTHPTCEG